MRILRFQDLRQQKGITWTRTHIGREEQDGRFPKRINLGPNSVGWVEDEVDAWLEAKVAARDAAKGGGDAHVRVGGDAASPADAEGAPEVDSTPGPDDAGPGEPGRADGPGESGSPGPS